MYLWTTFLLALTVVAYLVGYVQADCNGLTLEGALATASPIVLDSNGQVTLQQIKDTTQGLFRMRLAYTGGHAWIGIGINLNGQSKMTPTQAVMGRQEDDGAATTTVHKYRLAGDDDDGSGVVQLGSNIQADLVDATFVQEETNGMLTSVLEFTHPLVDSDGVSVTDTSMWVYAVGLSDNQWAGRHLVHGSFQLPLTECSTSSNNNDDAGNVVNQGGQEGEYEGGTAGGASGLILIETEPEGEILYVAHGILMGVAWGLLAPLAIGASMVRRLPFLQKNATWLKVHLYLNVLVVLLTTIGFGLVVAATNKNGDDHFTENTHTKVGLAVFVLVFVQALFGYYRPPAAKKTIDKELDKTVEGSAQYAMDASRMDANANGKVEQSAPNTPAEKSTLRVGWEYGHRLLAATLVGLAWYNCHSGIELQADDFGAGKVDLVAVFWGVAGGVSLLIVVTSLFLRAHQ